MERKQIVIITATLTVFAWRVVMVAIGQSAAIATLAPALGLTVQQIVRAFRPQTRKPLARAPLALETGLPGVFAVGDVRSGSVKRVASAVGEGAMAVRLAHEHLGEVRPPAIR